MRQGISKRKFLVERSGKIRYNAAECTCRGGTTHAANGRPHGARIYDRGRKAESAQGNGSAAETGIFLSETLLEAVYVDFVRHWDILPLGLVPFRADGPDRGRFGGKERRGDFGATDFAVPGRHAGQQPDWSRPELSEQLDRPAYHL